MRTVFNKTILLLERHSGNGHTGHESGTYRAVRASVSQPSYSLSIRAEAAGQKVDYMVTVRRKDYEAGAFNYAVVNGVTYRITSANGAEKEMFVRLVLEKN